LGRVGDHVTNGVDVRIGGALLSVSDDEAAVVDLDAGALGHEALGSRTATDRHDDHVDADVIATFDGDRRRSFLGL